ncbi:MAG: efflux RND transporter periplasmic adaptor subunit [Sulfuritalea sp.]|nr:efflux RND transporter periplasmic adaptor subunit [Sulfuritalea sp.]
MQQLSIAVLTAALLQLGLSAARAADLPPPPRPGAAPVAPPRPVIAVQSGNAGKKLGDEMECLLEPHLVANVGSPVEGTLNQVLVDRGSAVGKGQVVARLNSSVEAANLELRMAQEEFGKRKVERNKELFSKELISANEKDEIETQTRIAGLEVKQQQQVLEQRSIRSPLNGVVVERFLGPGERVANEKPILRIAQIDPLNVEVIAPVELFGAIRPGMAADIRLDPLLSGVYKARVVVVDRVIDAASGTFGVRLELSNPGNKVPAGIKCRARFPAR